MNNFQRCILTIVLFLTLVLYSLFEAGGVGIIGDPDGTPTIFVSSTLSDFYKFLPLLLSILFFVINYRRFNWWKNLLYSMLVLTILMLFSIVLFAMRIYFHLI